MSFDFTPPFEYTNGWRDIVNSVGQSVDERSAALTSGVVWSTDVPFTIPNGGTVTVDARFNDPVLNAFTPDAVTDFETTGAGTVTAVLSRDSGQSINIMLSSVGGSATVLTLQLRATPLPVARNVVVATTEPFSIGIHGLKEFQGSIPWANANDAQAVEESILAAYSVRTPLVQLHVQVKDQTYLLQQLTRTISDRITIVNGEMGMSADFFVENVDHTIFRTDPNKLPVHETVFGCGQVPVAAVINPFTFDKTGAGFDQGAFGAIVADDPDTIFIFDDLVQGKFDTGVFAT